MVFNLIKINLTALFAGVFRGLRRYKKPKPVVTILIGLLIVYIAGAVMLSVGVMFNGLCKQFFAVGLGWFYFALAGLYIFALCFIGGIFMVQTQIFSARDNELLMSLPVKPSAILAGRLAALLVVEYAFVAMIAVPAFVVLIINDCLSLLPALGIVFFVLATLLLPLLSISLGCLVGWAVAMVSSRLRRKNIVTLVLSLGFLVAYFWFYSRMMEYMNMLIEKGAEIADAVRRSVFPAYHYGVAVARGDILSFLLFALCAMIPFALMYIILSASFMKLVAGGRGLKKVVYREKTLSASGARLALLKRELMYFWSQPMYIMNSAMGSLSSLVIAGILAVRPGLVLSFFEPGSGALAGAIDPALAGAIVLAALAAMNFMSAPSISLEGKNLWIAKSLPVPSRDILMAKALLHLAVGGVPTVIAAAACIIVIPMNAAQIALTLILPALATLLFALLGVTLNLMFPRFDWINPIQPVKQGLSTMLSMFGGMALIAALALLYAFGPGDALTLEVYLMLCAALCAAGSAGLYAYLKGPGCRRFDSL